MPLPNPRKQLVFRVRNNALTRFVQPGTGFTADTTVQVTHLPAAGETELTFATSFVRFASDIRLVVSVICTTLDTVARPSQGNIKVTATTAGVATDSSSVQFDFFGTKTTIDMPNMPRHGLRLKVGDKSSVNVAAVGFAGLNGDVGVTVTRATKGTWAVVKATQKADKVRVILKCIALTSPAGIVTTVLEPPTSALCITMTADDDTVTEVLQMDTVFIDDPDIE